MEETINGQGPQPVATIVIAMLPDGNIQYQAKVPNRQIFMMMMGMAQADLERSLYAQEQQAKVAVAPPGFDITKLRGGF